MTNSSLFAEAKRFIPGGVNSPVRAFRNVGGEPFFVSRAKGSHIWDIEGRELIDYVGTWGPAILGHAPDVVVEAVREAALAGLSFGIPNPLEVEMARLICTWVPSVEKVRMVNSGTEATMSCIRLARGFTGRKLIVKFEGCYHGHVDSLLVKAGSGALTHGSPDSAGIPPEFAQLTIAIPFNNPEVLAETFQKFGEQIAAVIVEAVPANAGLFLPQPGFYAGLRRICDQYSTLLIFDEVMTGFRLAKGGYQAIAKIKPDLTAMGKVIGGGLPVEVKSWIFYLRTDQFIRLERFPAIRSRWRLGSPSCGNWNESTDGLSSKRSVSRWRAVSGEFCTNSAEDTNLIGSARCFASSSRKSRC